MMRTYQHGFIKKHKGCGGLVRYVELLGSSHHGWDAECLACGLMCEESEIEFERKCNGFHDVDEFYKE